MQCRVGPGRRPGGSSSSPVVPERPSARRHCRVRDVMADTSSGGERQQRGHPKAESGERAELDRQGEAGREASHGMSETFCSACSSQVGRFPTLCQKPSVAQHAALRPGGFPWHIRNLLVVLQLSGQEECVVRKPPWWWSLDPLLSSSFPADVTARAAGVGAVCAPPGMAVCLGIRPHERLLPGH